MASASEEGAPMLASKMVGAPAARLRVRNMSSPSISSPLRREIRAFGLENKENNSLILSPPPAAGPTLPATADVFDADPLETTVSAQSSRALPDGLLSPPPPPPLCLLRVMRGSSESLDSIDASMMDDEEADLATPGSKRDHALQEILTTEESYIAALTFIRDRYIYPLRYACFLPDDQRMPIIQAIIPPTNPSTSDK
jgi:hypothetical protein